MLSRYRIRHSGQFLRCILALRCILCIPVHKMHRKARIFRTTSRCRERCMERWRMWRPEAWAISGPEAWAISGPGCAGTVGGLGHGDPARDHDDADQAGADDLVA